VNSGHSNAATDALGQNSSWNYSLHPSYMTQKKMHIYTTKQNLNGFHYATKSKPKIC